jgi:hypothetical protein
MEMQMKRGYSDAHSARQMTRQNIRQMTVIRRRQNYVRHSAESGFSSISLGFLLQVGSSRTGCVKRAMPLKVRSPDFLGPHSAVAQRQSTVRMT